MNRRRTTPTAAGRPDPVVVGGDDSTPVPAPTPAPEPVPDCVVASTDAAVLADAAATCVDPATGETMLVLDYLAALAAATTPEPSESATPSNG